MTSMPDGEQREAFREWATKAALNGYTMRSADNPIGAAQRLRIEALCIGWEFDQDGEIDDASGLLLAARDYYLTRKHRMPARHNRPITRRWPMLAAKMPNVNTGRA